MLLDFSRYETFILDFRGSVKDMRFKNVRPGQLYVFVLVQDDTGGHTITWGASALNGARMDEEPDAITVQAFIATKDNTLQSITPATWTEG